VVKTVATLALQRFSFAATPGHVLAFHLMPTIGPKGGLPMVLAAREAPAAAHHHTEAA
jgi:hypothetical protein